MKNECDESEDANESCYEAGGIENASGLRGAWTIGIGYATMRKTSYMREYLMPSCFEHDEGWMNGENELGKCWMMGSR